MVVPPVQKRLLGKLDNKIQTNCWSKKDEMLFDAIVKNKLKSPREEIHARPFSPLVRSKDFENVFDAMKEGTKQLGESVSKRKKVVFDCPIVSFNEIESYNVYE